MSKAYKDLEKVLRANVDDPDHCVFLHPGDSRGFTDEELDARKYRDFETRLFVTGAPFAGDSVFLRNFHTDNAPHSSNFNYVRDYLKAFHVIKNRTCAKSVLTTLLTMSFQLDPSDYYSFAISLASGLSENARNTDFETSQTSNSKVEETDIEERDRLAKESASFRIVSQRRKLHDDSEDNSLIRRKLCFLMDIVFKRLAVRKFLVDDQKSNIYRLVHCRTKYSDDKKSIFIALFAFILQVSLATYVVLEVLFPPPENEDLKIKMLPLAIFTSMYSLMVTVTNWNESFHAYQVYGKIGVLQMMDLVMSAFIPALLTVTGFIVIVKESRIVDGVLNSTALLFIPEIDDHLPHILGLQIEEIVQNFLVAESITTFDDIAKLGNEEFTLHEKAKRNITTGVQFSDFYITNMPEQGATDDTPFQPYQVTIDHNDMGDQIDPSSFVTIDCLLKRIEWRYTTGYPRTTKPRIGYLHLTKINDEVVEVERKSDPLGLVGISTESHVLEGMFIITTFQMSEDIIKLRVCGSYNPRDFLEAFECYSLWDINTSARKAIMALAIPHVKEDERPGNIFVDNV